MPGPTPVSAGVILMNYNDLGVELVNTVAILKSNGTLRRMGAAAFAFFFLKGLLWIAAPFVFLWLT